MTATEHQGPGAIDCIRDRRPLAPSLRDQRQTHQERREYSEQGPAGAP